MTADDSNSLEVLQNNCLRICLQVDKYTSRRDLYQELGICSLAKSKEDHTTKMVFLGMSDRSTRYINQLFMKVSDTHDRNTRASAHNLLSVPRSNLECCKGNIQVRGPTYYNRLSEHVRQSETVDTFKRRLKLSHEPI